ncbi:hypothetical protein [Nocardia sp. NPDC127526]|uniref:hypothetical protein n=1 Tax=Nocardia sp. NPDC127526 TaxID=3345393 RepID=UPI0036424467
MSKHWYTSDLHIGHRRVAELRGFDSTDAHDRELAFNWDWMIGPTDIVWVLGDISVGGKANEDNAIEWISKRPGTKHLIAGNHDNCHPMRSKAHAWQRRYLKAFDSVQQTAVRKIAGQRVTLSHFPFHGDPDGDHTPENRFEEWRVHDHGGWHLHGHTHSGNPARGRQIHVGVDAHLLEPVPHSWVERVITQ